MMKELYTALLKAQSEIKPMVTTDIATITGEKGSFKYRYLALPALLAEVLPVLNRHGLLLLQFATTDGDKAAVVTKLVHAETAQEIETVLALPIQAQRNAIQAIGSSITYARRYQLLSLVGISAEDDDGAGAQKTEDRPGYKPEPPKAIHAPEQDDVVTRIGAQISAQKLADSEKTVWREKVRAAKGNRAELEKILKEITPVKEDVF